MGQTAYPLLCRKAENVQREGFSEQGVTAKLGEIRVPVLKEA